MRFLSFTSGTIVLLSTFILSVLCTPNTGIRKDWFAEGDHSDLVSFSVVLIFQPKADGTSPVPDLSDAQLVGVCAKAFDEMRSTPGNYDKPAAMALLAVGHEVYLASSIKSDRRNWLGRGKDTDDQRPQILAKAAGVARIAGSNHRNGGACSEINIMDLYYSHNRILDFSGKKARIVVWATKDGDTNIFNPCSTPVNGYGCGDFLRTIANPSNPSQPLEDDNLKVIEKKTKRDDGWPNGVEFSSWYMRLTQDDKDACEAIDDEPFDPNNPDQ